MDATKYSPEVKLAGRKASNSESNMKSLIFLGILWFSLLVALGVLVVLLLLNFSHLRLYGRR